MSLTHHDGSDGAAGRASTGGLRLAHVSLARGGRQVLQDISVRFLPGRVTAVIGPNGAGKSTLLEIAAGLLPPDAGSVELDGRPIATVGRRRLATQRAYLPQSARVEWPISVERVVALGLAPVLPAFGRLPRSWLTRIDRALELHDLLPLRQRPASELSGGELARTLLARATVGDPGLLIVDEPTSGLDPRHALDAVRRLRARADAGAAVILAIHDLQLALRCADDVVALRGGRLLAIGSLRDTLSEDLLAALYDVQARLTRDEHGVSVRFLDP